MDYKNFVKKLNENNINLFDYDKRKLYYQLKSKKENLNQTGGCIDKFFKCENKKIILKFYKKNDIDIQFINSNYESI